MKGCKLLLEPTKKRGEADVIAGQTCRLSALGYEGTANAKGTLSREGRWLNAVFSFKPTETDLDGTLVVTFSGTAP